MIHTKEQILEKVDLHPLKIRNIYGFGSRVYQTYDEFSDYDYVVVATSLNEHTEIKPFDDDMNIHIITPDKFKKGLERHEMHYFECIFASEEFRILEKVDYRDKLTIDKNKLKRMAYGESFSAWKKAKKLITDGDHYRGLKAFYHGMRILDYAIQICEKGTIENFQSLNGFWNEIKDTSYSNYYTYKDLYFKDKIELEKKLKNC